jgi:hypothetical protein
MTKINKEKDLKKEGWKKQFTYDEPRLSEAVELYESLGLDVKLEPVKPEELDGNQCKTCFETMCDRYKTIYTREKEKCV